MCSAKEGVAHGFSRNAHRYNDKSVAQQASLKRLLDMLPGRNYSDILDVGCGTAQVCKYLVEDKQNHNINYTGIDIAQGMIDYCRQEHPGRDFFCIDAERYISDKRYDLIISNFAFQWFEDIHGGVQKYLNMLKPGGSFALSVPVFGSLPEVVDSFERIGLGANIMKFPTWQDVVDIFYQNGAEVKSQDVCHISSHFEDARACLYAIKDIGAGMGNMGVLPSQMKRFLKAYDDEYFTEGKGVSLTYKVLFIVACRGGVS